MARILYYYQTLTSVGSLIPHCDATDVLLSAFHFGYTSEGRPYIHLNNTDPEDPSYDSLWSQLSKLDARIGIMIGGAGGAFQTLFSNFDIFYPLLTHFLKQHADLIQGINLDIEEPTHLIHIQHLVMQLRHDFSSMELSLAPVLSELLNPTEPGAFSGFAYQDLFDTLGDHFAYIAVQMYGGSFTAANYKDLVAVFTLDTSMLVPGMESSDYPTPYDFQHALTELAAMKQCTGPLFGGAFVWEFCDAPPQARVNPSRWATLVAHTLASN